MHTSPHLAQRSERWNGYPRDKRNRYTRIAFCMFWLAERIFNLLSWRRRRLAILADSRPPKMLVKPCTTRFEPEAVLRAGRRRSWPRSRSRSRSPVRGSHESHEQVEGHRALQREFDRRQRASDNGAQVVVNVSEITNPTGPLEALAQPVAAQAAERRAVFCKKVVSAVIDRRQMEVKLCKKLYMKNGKRNDYQLEQEFGKIVGLAKSFCWSAAHNKLNGVRARAEATTHGPPPTRLRCACLRRTTQLRSLRGRLRAPIDCRRTRCSSTCCSTPTSTSPRASRMSCASS